MPAQPLDEIGRPEQQPGLRSPEQLVATGGDQVGALAQRRRRVGLVGQQWVRREQARADIDHQGRFQASANSAIDTAEVNPLT